MGDVRVKHVGVSRTVRRLLPLSPRLVRERTERDDGLDGALRKESGEPETAIRRNLRIARVVHGTVLAVSTVEKSVHHDVARIDSELGQKPLQSLSGRPNEDAPNEGFVLPGILTDDQHARGSVEPPAVKDGAPFRSKGGLGVNVRARITRDELTKWLFAVPLIELMRHDPSSRRFASDTRFGGEARRRKKRPGRR